MSGRYATSIFVTSGLLTFREISMSKIRRIGQLVLLVGGAAAFADGFAQQTFAYPPTGRTPEQQRQDQYECHQWATEQSHFDPVQAASQPPRSAASTPQASAPGPSVGGAIIGGAAKGAALAKLGDSDTTDGARAGAALGLLGQRRAQASTAAANAQAQKSAQQQRQAEQQAQQKGQQAYERAKSTCLKARGYTLSEG
jgi:hypothetical protein